MSQRYTYGAALAASEKVNWRVEDLIGGEKKLDFSKPFLPEALARVQGLDFLSEREKLLLNQVRGHTYLYMFGLVEEAIVPFVLDHTRVELGKDDIQTRALLQFAGEEAKHIDLFNRFRREFVQGFGTECQVIGPAQEIAAAIMDHDPLAVGLVILQIEWMTQKHYTESIQGAEIDPLFKSLLKHHWMEEAQHANLDTLILEAMAATLSQDEIDRAIEQYFEIAAFVDEGLLQQVEYDLQSLERASGRRLGDAERDRFREVQRAATRYTFLGSGMQHTRFLETLGSIHAGARAKVEELTPAFC